MLSSLEAEFFHTFKDPELLRIALRHKSHANEERKKLASPEEFVRLHNERLEFLGDSVLGLLITDILTARFPLADEGILSRMRSSLVRAETLASLARKVKLGEHLSLGKGEESTQGRDKDSILSSTYEAVLGAIYLDGGLPAAQETVAKHFAEFLTEVAAQAIHGDTKTQLQETCQARFRCSPQYAVVSEDGPDHAKIFEVAVSVDNLRRYGKGRSKKEAEQIAARYLLEALRTEPETQEKNARI